MNIEENQFISPKGLDENINNCSQILQDADISQLELGEELSF